MIAMAELSNKSTLEETTDEAPALASHSGLLFLAWKGAGNENLNVAYSEDDGASFRTKVSYSDTSDRAPALVSIYGGPLAIAWKGAGNENLNVAAVPLFSGGIGDGLSEKTTFDESSGDAPSLGRWGSSVALGWRGAGNDNLNVALLDGLHSIYQKATFPTTSDRAPALSVVYTALCVAWRDDVSSIICVAATRGQLGTERDELERASVVAHSSHEDHTQRTDLSPALTDHENHAVVAFKGAGNDNLNVMRHIDPGGTPHSYWEGSPLEETSDRTPAVTSHNGRLVIAWKGSGNENLNVATVVL